MTYDELHKAMIPVSPETRQAYVELCQRNAWLMRGGIPFEDDPCLEFDSEYSIVELKELDTLESFFQYGNGSIRQGILYHDLIFANQVNGGDEWWMCKRFGEMRIPFESISFRLIIQQGGFAKFIKRLDEATRYLFRQRDGDFFLVGTSAVYTNRGRMARHGWAWVLDGSRRKAGNKVGFAP